MDIDEFDSNGSEKKSLEKSCLFFVFVAENAIKSNDQVNV